MKAKQHATEPFSDWSGESLARELFTRFGPLVGGSDLARLLGFQTVAALRQAELRKTLGVKTFGIENRRGRFAFTQDVSTWLAQLRLRTVDGVAPSEEGNRHDG